MQKLAPKRRNTLLFSCLLFHLTTQYFSYIAAFLRGGYEIVTKWFYWK